MAQPPAQQPEAGEPGGPTAGAAAGDSSNLVPRTAVSSNPIPCMGLSSTPALRVEQSSTPVPRMGLSSTPAPRMRDSTTRGPQVGDSSTPGAQMEQPATLVVKMEAPAASHVRTAESTNPFTQMEEASTPTTRMEGPASPSQPTEETTNPFTRREVPTARHDLSRLYPPLPRGDYTPSHVAQPGDPGPRDDYFVLRPGTIEEAVKDVRSKLAGEQGQFNSCWILTEVDHWNRESERLLIIAERSLLVCQYDFIGLYCNQILCVPLHYIDTITLGPFTFPERSFSRRDGTGLRIQWDKLREPSFLERWNPWSSQMPAPRPD
ncbi:tumor protein p63-regulated gene 1 protein-like [Heterodontus francisci]|uniref:tumor protein p63-regulated gene 1 protein-like n=1 Tax=Heterodontus francisci TaxID=7792 RepID=UPI00355B5CF0